MAFTVDIRGNASHLEKTLGLAKGRLLDLGNVATTGVAGLAALGAAGAAGLGAFIISSSQAASNVESLTMQFETLLGGADAAGKRMEEITKFAASTPFEIAELAATSKLLQTMGGNLLATGDGLRMVGDAAAISGQPLQEVGLHVGRLFNAITSGTSAGESVARLQELGLMTGTVKREFEALAASQKTGATASLTQEQALAKLREVFKSTEGAMARLATTTQGKMSGLADNISTLKVAFGTGFNDGLKVALDATNTFLPQLEMKFKKAGELVGSAITDSLSGNYDKFAAIGEAAGNIFVAAMKAGVIAGLDNLGEYLGDKIATMAEKAPGLGMLQLAPDSLRQKVGSEIRDFTSGGTSFREQLGNSMESSGANASINQLKIQQQITEGIKTGITTTMSNEVKKGILEAWAKQYRGATFAN